MYKQCHRFTQMFFGSMVRQGGLESCWRDLWEENLAVHIHLSMNARLSEKLCGSIAQGIWRIVQQQLFSKEEYKDVQLGDFRGEHGKFKGERKSESIAYTSMVYGWVRQLPSHTLRISVAQCLLIPLIGDEVVTHFEHDEDLCESDMDNAEVRDAIIQISKHFNTAHDHELHSTHHTPQPINPAHYFGPESTEESGVSSDSIVEHPIDSDESGVEYFEALDPDESGGDTESISDGSVYDNVDEGWGYAHWGNGDGEFSEEQVTSSEEEEERPASEEEAVFTDQELDYNALRDVEMAMMESDEDARAMDNHFASVDIFPIPPRRVIDSDTDTHSPRARPRYIAPCSSDSDYVSLNGSESDKSD